MTGNQFGHFEHGNFLLAEDRHKFVISENVSFVCWILKIILLDVFPNFLHNLSARHRCSAYDRTEVGGGSHRLHEGRICSSCHKIM